VDRELRATAGLEADYMTTKTVAGNPGLGLIPAKESSSDKRHLGHISKQGNTLVRWLLVEAAVAAQRHDASWRWQ